LISGIIPASTEEDIDSFLAIRQGIARYLPEYDLNYLQTFEAFRRLEDWDNAAVYCDLLQQYSSPRTGVNAATCDARIAFYQRDYQTSVRLLEPRFERYADDPAFLVWYGNSLLGTDRLVEAEEIYKRAISREQDGAALLTLYWRLGDAQNEQGKRREAIDSYTNALQYATSEHNIAQLQNILNVLQR
jgi:tetratricopeptide (TPR) repeat protein